MKSEMDFGGLIKSAYYNSTFWADDGRQFEMYKCDRCQQPHDVVASDAKEIFDYFMLTEFILCKDCRSELDNMKSNPYKVRAVFELMAANGSAVHEDVTEVFKTMKDVDKYIIASEERLNEAMLSSGFMLKDKRYEISYIPYADRR